jgi:DNA-directed RNA polymerase specialized sigma24 family protein
MITAMARQRTQPTTPDLFSTELVRNGASPQVSASKETAYGLSQDDRRVELATGSLTRGQVNAVRAAYKAGVTPSQIARQFGISQSDVRKALMADTTTKRRR